MSKFKSPILVIATISVALIGIYLLNQISSNNALNRSSANVYNIAALNLVEENILYPNNVVIDLNLQVLSKQSVDSGVFVISYVKELLDVQDIIMPNNVIGLNQKIDVANGIITLEVKSPDKFSDIQNLARIIFSKKESEEKFSSVTILKESKLGDPNTLEPVEKSLSLAI